MSLNGKLVWNNGSLSLRTQKNETESMFNKVGFRVLLNDAVFYTGRNDVVFMPNPTLDRCRLVRINTAPFVRCFHCRTGGSGFDWFF